MSSRKRTNKSPKGHGYDYTGRRLGNDGMNGHGPATKRRTHRWERAEGREIILREREMQE